jgi:hypothetical protein
MHIARGAQTGFVISILPYGPRDRHKTLLGAYKQDFRRQRNRALRDRDALSEGGTDKFRDFDALLRDLTGGIEITMPSACVTESPSPLAIAQGSLWVLSLSERKYHSGGAEPYIIIIASHVSARAQPSFLLLLSASGSSLVVKYFFSRRLLRS